MPEFAYVAREMSGQQVTGVLEASNKQDALGSLATQKLFPVRVELSEAAGRRQTRIGRRVGGRHLAVFYGQLADLLNSGVPLLRSLELLEKQSSHATLRLIIQDVSEQVAEGTRLAEAMRRHPRVFGSLAISMVRAGEEGAFLEEVLKRIGSFTEHQQELKSRVLGAMVYPAFLSVAMTAVVIAMLTFFVPKFQPIFDRMSERGSLPWATTALMTTSDFFLKWWPLGLGAVLAAAYAGSSWSRTDAGQRKLDEFKLNAFGVGPIVKTLAIARFCRILGTLLLGGVPILQSLRIAKDATGNVVLSRAIGAAAENISEGKSLARPLAGSRQFPEEVVEMISVGEEANNLEQVLIDVADSMERRTNRLLDLFVRMLEPVLLTVMGGVVLFVVVALLWPILQSSSVL